MTAGVVATLDIAGAYADKAAGKYAVGRIGGDGACVVAILDGAVGVDVRAGIGRHADNTARGSVGAFRGSDITGIMAARNTDFNCGADKATETKACSANDIACVRAVYHIGIAGTGNTADRAISLHASGIMTVDQRSIFLAETDDAAGMDI